MSHLAADDLAKLTKVLELALHDSTPEGERAAATARAIAILNRHGMRWTDVARQMQAEPVHCEPMQSAWRQVCIRLQQQPGELRPWERRFITDLPKFWRLSTKQRYCLNEIARRVLGDDRAPG